MGMSGGGGGGVERREKKLCWGSVTRGAGKASAAEFLILEKASAAEQGGRDADD